MLRPSSHRLALLLAVLVLAACGCSDGRSVATSGGPAPFVEDPNLHRDDVQDLALGDVLQVPYIFWGGDVPTFMANGGENTEKGSTFDKHGLKLHLVKGDDFAQQVKDYKAGNSPFLRGTISMLAQTADDAGGDARTRPVVFLQLTWSAGDHLVARQALHRLDDLRGKKVALQKGGPHVGMLNDILHTADLQWSDIQVVWTEDVTGDKGPAEKFRKDPTIDASFCITPDMIPLTGGLHETGDGKGTTIAGAHVLVSTADMKRSIADVYACRKDFYDKHRDVVEKFAAGYLKATEELVAIKKQVKDEPTAKYRAVIALTRKMFGKDLDSDQAADGLIADAVFVGLPGNYAFFKDPGNLSGFAAKQSAALKMASALHDIQREIPLVASDLDYGKVKNLGSLTATADPPRTAHFTDNPSEKNVLYSFNVYFDGGQDQFPASRYGEQFRRAIEMASLFGNAIVSMKGHANPDNFIDQIRNAAVSKGAVTSRGGKFFRKDGSEIDMNNMKQVLRLIEQEKLGNVPIRQPPINVMGANAFMAMLQDLSERRSKSVRKAVTDYAAANRLRFDESQIKSGALGGSEPVVPIAHGEPDGQKNRRVEVRIIQVGAGDIKLEEFDF
jgi:ABC-type nitrate/sulfonate/bicarbonate transport system substrate-binding protein